MKTKYSPYIFISPFFIIFGVFMAYPLSDSLRLSTYAARGMEDLNFVGLGNFERLLADPVFWIALWNTVYFALGSLLLQLPIALFLALLLSKSNLRGRNWFRLIFFFPVLISGVFIAILFYVI